MVSADGGQTIFDKVGFFASTRTLMVIQWRKDRIHKPIQVGLGGISFNSGRSDG